MMAEKLAGMVAGMMTAVMIHSMKVDSSTFLFALPRMQVLLDEESGCTEF